MLYLVPFFLMYTSLILHVWYDYTCSLLFSFNEQQNTFFIYMYLYSILFEIRDCMLVTFFLYCVVFALMEYVLCFSFVCMFCRLSYYVCLFLCDECSLACVCAITVLLSRRIEISAIFVIIVIKREVLASH